MSGLHCGEGPVYGRHHASGRHGRKNGFSQAELDAARAAAERERREAARSRTEWQDKASAATSAEARTAAREAALTEREGALEAQVRPRLMWLFDPAAMLLCTHAAAAKFRPVDVLRVAAAS